MRGRHAIGPEIGERVTDSPEAGTRLRLILETIAGHKLVRDACAELNICEQLFERLRDRSMRSAARALVLKSAGRPRRDASAADKENAGLRQRVAALEAQLQAALIRAELATTLPRLGGEAGKKS